MRLGPTGTWWDVDPYRRARLDAVMRAAGEKPIRSVVAANGVETCFWAPAQVIDVSSKRKEPVREEIALRLFDPRALGQPHASEKGGVTLEQLFAEVQTRGDGVVDGPAMPVIPAYSGRDVDEGIRAVNDLLDFNEELPVVPVLNEPRMRISEACEQLDWVLTNYTGEGSESDGGKDPADLLRYLALTEDVQYVPENAMRVRKGYAY